MECENDKDVDITEKNIDTEAKSALVNVETCLEGTEQLMSEDEQQESESNVISIDLSGPTTTMVAPKMVIDYNLNIPPTCLTLASKEFSGAQLADAPTRQRRTNNFLKGCKWSPDGSCLLSNSEDRCLRLFNLPSQLCQSPPLFDSQFDEMTSVLQIRESELIYDYCWYPLMNSCDQATCLIASTSRDNPIHLFDAYTGKLVYTYKSLNYADEIISANCLTFNHDGSKIFCGFNKSIRIFDTCNPGRECLVRNTNEDKQGQHGIISCISVNPVNPNIYAAGSYAKSIGLYEEPLGNQICILVGHKGGITHLMFSNDGNRLYSGGRKDPEILCWDIRNLGDVLQVINRDVTTNQRIYFDISPDSSILATGDDSGKVMFFDIANDCSEASLPIIQSFQANNDCVNGVSFHPTLALLATSSGQRKFDSFEEINDSDREEDADSTDDRSLTNGKMQRENNLKLWCLCEPNIYSSLSSSSCTEIPIVSQSD